MIPMTVKAVAAAVGGALNDVDPDASVDAVTIDSRAVSTGALFVALPGDRVDGHAFVDEAVNAGAIASLVRTDRDSRGPRIEVADVGAALMALGAAHRDLLTGAVIAVTGSSGKTCTKDMIAAACAQALRTVASPASHNNEIGVPLTVLSAEEGTQALVVEVGSRGIGHIATLMPVVRPTVAVVTNVGSAHVGMFGSLEDTARAKGELVEGLTPTGVAILNADDPRVVAMADRAPGRVVTFGRAPIADVRALDVTLDADARATVTAMVAGEQVVMTLAMTGEHMADDALAALAAACEVGVSPAVAAAGIAACTGSRWRMQIQDVGARRIINDAYNANPDSMVAALKTLATMGQGRQRWAVLGVMAELGDAATAEHDRIGRMTVRLGIDRLVVVGREARAIFEAARLEGLFDSGDAVFVETPDDALAIVRAEAADDAVILVKGSRAAGLESIAEGLIR